MVFLGVAEVDGAVERNEQSLVVFGVLFCLSR
jgi:hypothetical protein